MSILSRLPCVGLAPQLSRLPSVLGLVAADACADVLCQRFADIFGDNRIRLMTLLARVLVLLVDPGDPCPAGPAVGDAGIVTTAGGFIAPVARCEGETMAVSKAGGATSAKATASTAARSAFALAASSSAAILASSATLAAASSAAILAASSAVTLASSCALAAASSAATLASSCALAAASSAATLPSSAALTRAASATIASSAAVASASACSRAAVASAATCLSSFSSLISRSRFF